jgi:hypothetical protein
MTYLGGAVNRNNGSYVICAYLGITLCIKQSLLK